MTYPTQKELQEILRYDPETGIFTWRTSSPMARVSVGQEAGTLGFSGYIVIGIRRRQYYAHRLAWIYMMGQLPQSEIDHKDNNGANNQWSNLREATHSQNQMNKKSVRKTAGLKGTTFARRQGKWQAQIRINKKTISLGYFPTAEGAHLAYCRAATRLFGEFASAE